jgi:hypothetical protein
MMRHKVGRALQAGEASADDHNAAQDAWFVILIGHTDPRQIAFWRRQAGSSSCRSLTWRARAAQTNNHQMFRE